MKKFLTRAAVNAFIATPCAGLIAWAFGWAGEGTDIFWVCSGALVASVVTDGWLTWRERKSNA